MKQRQVGTILGIIFVIIGLGLGSVRAAELESHISFLITNKGNDLVIMLNDVQTKARIVGFMQYDDAQKTDMTDQLTELLQFCSSKGDWAYQIASRAGEDPRSQTVQSEIEQMYYEYEGSLVKRATKVDSERIIRTAYKHGYEDPLHFAEQNAEWCMYERF